MTEPEISVILPAHNEAEYLSACLAALLQSDTGGTAAEVLVIANACTDSTAQVARGFGETAQAAGWGFEVIETATPGKLNALNLGDAQASGAMRAYLDADVVVSPDLLGQLVSALRSDAPRYASGTPIVAPAHSAMTRGFARIWQRLPFVTQGVPGFGIFAVNAAGRARWETFPDDIISDDTFVRLSFAPSERVRVPATYSWPMVEGLRNLVLVRRRQDEGVREIAERFPDLLVNEETAPLGKGGVMRLAATDPLGFASYALVKLLVKTPYAKSAQRWARGR